MRYYPIFLDIRSRPCLVVGGGRVAERKALSLLAAGARVTVVAPRATTTLAALAKGGRITLQKKGFTKGSARGFFLVIAAAGSRAVNSAVWTEASQEGALVNVVDAPDKCGFIAPSVVERGDLLVAISTSGQSPYLSRRLREELEGAIGPEYETFVEILGAARRKLLKTALSRDKKERIIKALVKSPLPGLIRDGDTRGINEVLSSTAGKGYSLSRLGIKIQSLSRGAKPSPGGVSPKR